MAEALKSKISKAKANGESLQVIQSLEDQREVAKQDRDAWFDRHFKYIQKINEQASIDDSEKAEEICA